MNNEKEHNKIMQGLEPLFTQDNTANLDSLNQYRDSFKIAVDTILSEASKNKPLKWKNGENIVLYGENVAMFKSTEKQYKDNKMFGNINYPSVVPNYSQGHSYITDDIALMNGMSKSDLPHKNELFSYAAKNKPDNEGYLAQKYNEYFISPKGAVEPVYPETWLLGPGRLAAIRLQDKMIKLGNYTNNINVGLGNVVSKYPNVSGAISDGVISGGIHSAYKISTGQDINGYELLAAFSSGAISRNHTIPNQIRINLGITTVSSLSKDPSGGELMKDYYGAAVSPIISGAASKLPGSTYIGGGLSEYLGDLDKVNELYKSLKEKYMNKDGKNEK